MRFFIFFLALVSLCRPATSQRRLRVVRQFEQLQEADAVRVQPPPDKEQVAGVDEDAVDTAVSAQLKIEAKEMQAGGLFESSEKREVSNLDDKKSDLSSSASSSSDDDEEAVGDESYDSVEDQIDAHEQASASVVQESSPESSSSSSSDSEDDSVVANEEEGSAAVIKNGAGGVEPTTSAVTEQRTKGAVDYAEIAEEEEIEELMSEIEQEENEIQDMKALGSVIGVFLVILTAHQMSENPDGLYASTCRLILTAVGVVFGLILSPVKWLFPRRHGSYGYVPTSTDYGFRDPSLS